MLLLMIFLFDLLGKLKLERDFSRYNYLGLDSARVNGVDDASNFRTVRVRRSRGWLCTQRQCRVLWLLVCLFMQGHLSCWHFSCWDRGCLCRETWTQLGNRVKFLEYSYGNAKRTKKEELKKKPKQNSPKPKRNKQTKRKQKKGNKKAQMPWSDPGKSYIL